ncbi:MAG: FecR domain-containing protein [Saprospiraceae bacterium]
MSNINLHNFQNELIEDDSFIKWVRSEFQEDDDRWSAFIDDHPENTNEINAAIAFIRNFEFKDEKSFDHNKVWERISVSAELKPIKEARVKQLFPNTIKIIALLAAACILLIVVFRMGISTEKEVNSHIAEQINEALPDGSKVLLNSDSKILYNPKTWKESRTVKLEGTAYFEVEKGSKFKVKTKLGEVTVLGTSFSVTSRDGLFEVICRTGKVAVKSSPKPSEEIILTPGDIVVLDGETLRLDRSKNENKNNISWLDGVYTFDAKPLSIVISELERQFDLKITIPNELRSEAYTGFFRDNDIQEALKSITWPLGLQYKIDGKKVTITR